jgi:hypothetical protein
MARSNVERRDPAVETLPITIALTVLWLLLHRAAAEVVYYLNDVVGQPIAGPLA